MDEPTSTEGPVVKEPAGEPEPIKPAVEPGVKGDKVPDPIPYPRFKEVNDELKTAKDELTKIRDDQKKVREEKLKEQGKTDELLKEREADLAIANKELEAFREDQDKRRESLLSKLPDEDRKFAETHLADRLSALEEYSERILQQAAGPPGDPRPTAPGEFKKPDKPFYEWTKEEKKAWAADIDKRQAA